MVCLVYDAQNKESFANIRFWFENICQHFDAEKNLVGCLIGNKSERYRLINQEAIKIASEEFGTKHFECSAVN